MGEDEAGSPATLPQSEQTHSHSGAIAAGTRLRVAIAHDWLVGMRGGERVLDSIVRLCADRFDIAGIFTMFDDGRPLSPAIDAQLKFVSHLSHFPAKLRRWLLPLYPGAVESLSRQLAFDHARKPIDLLISTSSAAIKGLKPPEGVAHVCYCHSPARYLWSQANQYAHGSGGTLRALGLRLFGPRLRVWDARSAAHVTTFLANSTHTQREIKRCYARDSVLVHPPVRTTFYTPAEPNRAAPERCDHWLCVGALEPYKRVDLAIRAAHLARKHLTIVGSGSQEGSLRDLAGSLETVGAKTTFAGRLSDESLRDEFRRAEILLFPQVEDFGIVAVEAQACGLPVVACPQGGALDSIVDETTGCFFDQPTAESIVDAARKCIRRGDISSVCRANAARFSEANFERAILRVIDDTMAGR